MTPTLYTQIYRYYLRQRGFVFTSVCQQDKSSTNFDNFLGVVGCATGNNWLDFGDDPDTWIFEVFLSLRYVGSAAVLL